MTDNQVDAFAEQQKYYAERRKAYLESKKMRDSDLSSDKNYMHNVDFSCTIPGPPTISDLYSRLESARQDYADASHALDRAHKDHCTALNQLNDCQAFFDEAVMQLRSQAPDGSDWAKVTGHKRPSRSPRDERQS